MCILNMIFHFVCSYLHACFQGWLFETNCCALPRGKAMASISRFPQFPLCRVEVLLVFIWFGMLIGLLLVQLTFGQSYWWDFMHIDSDVTRIQKSHNKLPDPQALTLFLPRLPQCLVLGSVLFVSGVFWLQAFHRTSRMSTRTLPTLPLIFGSG